MLLKNKKTGEIGNLVYRGLEDERIWVWTGNISKPEYRYNSLAKLNAEWCDAEDDIVKRKEYENGDNEYVVRINWRLLDKFISEGGEE